jgi:hypothetical protein
MSKAAAGTPPTDAELRRKLGRKYSCYEAFLARNSDLRPEWKYYGAKTGWTLKLFDRRRNLCFITPCEQQLLISFALGTAAVGRALDATLPDAVKQEIRDGPHYVEGTAARIVVNAKRDLVAAQVLLDIKRTC